MDATFINVYIAIVRYLMAILAAILIYRTVGPLISFRREPEIWAWLCLPDGNKLPVTHWENVIGRSRRSDIFVDDPNISKSHAVLTRYDDGSWTVSAVHGAGELRVNGKKVQIRALKPKDVITVGALDMNLQPISREQEKHLAKLRTKAATPYDSIVNLLVLTFIQVLMCVGYLMNGQTQHSSYILMGFGGIAACQWLLLVFYFIIRRPSFEVETLAFFLCTLGMAAICAVVPQESVKQLVAMGLGIGIFLIIGWCLRDLERAKKVRDVAVFAGIGFLLLTLFFGAEYYGAKNWLVIGSYSVQPSEFSKVCFVFVAASTMDKVMTRRNLIVFIAYSALICVCLALMNDFGTALIFFVAFLAGAFLRSGSVGTLALACTGVGFAGVLGLRLVPHAMRRFATWRHIWEHPLTGGYQQTQALMCVAAGGLLGLGAGQGQMRWLFAADSDMVVATISEEWGIFTIFVAVLAVVALAAFSIRSAQVGRSAFYTIGANTASAILVVQVILNALGTVDLVPLTGVTFPFVSNGGSSMICAWGLIAFVKAADTRQNASFAVRLPWKGGGADE